MVKRLVRRLPGVLLLLPAALVDHRLPGLVPPYGVAFKIVTVMGLLATPPAAYYLARSMRLGKHISPDRSGGGGGVRLLRELLDLRREHCIDPRRRVRLFVVLCAVPVLSRAAHQSGP